jgi:beta-lactam-binding protein with PASTA domain
VTSQNPLPGTALDPGSTMSVVVSSGPPQIDVPDVEGRLANEAIERAAERRVSRRTSSIWSTAALRPAPS